MVYYHDTHRSPEIATPLLRDIIAAALHSAETCQHARGRFFCAPTAAPTPDRPGAGALAPALAESELLRIALDFSFLYDASPELIYAELRQRFPAA